MANLKTGLAYYNVDTERYQDRRIKRLKKDFGCDGIAVYDYLLCEIYRDKGCFISWDESTAFDVAEYFGLKENTVKEIVNYCSVVGLFDKGLLCNESVLTSLSIQRRYIEMCSRAKRKNFKIPEKYKILPEEYVKLPEESTENTEVCDKEKKSKVNNPSIVPPLGIDPRYGDEILSIESLRSEILEWHSSWIEKVAMKIHSSIDQTTTFINNFFDHLVITGVEEKSVKDFKHYFGNWLKKELENERKEVKNATDDRTY